jgi:predicted DNA-binding transcriptional regulator
VLTILGVSEVGDAVYRELVSTASATVAELAGVLHEPETAVQEALFALERHGLVTRTVTRPPRFVAAPPDTAAERLLLRRQVELTDARAEIEQLARSYRSGRRSRSTDELVEIVIGAEALAHRVNQIQRSPKREFAGFVKPPFVAIDLDRAEHLQDPDIVYRAVYDRKMLTDYPGLVDLLRGNTAPRVEYRMHPSLPMKLLLADRETALLPLGRDNYDLAPAAVIVHSSGLVDALAALFDQYWEASTPLVVNIGLDGGETGADARPAIPWQLDAEDSRILSLLIGGVTDEAIARQLGVRLRTVRRRVQAMMHAASALNRAQLGWHAARSRWLLYFTATASWSRRSGTFRR